MAEYWDGAKDGTGITKWDPYLSPYAGVLRARYNRVCELKKLAEEREGGLLKFAQSYKRFGLHRDETGAVTYREWAPGAISMSLIGDFNGWNRGANPMRREDEWGHWVVTVPGGIPHGSKIKVDIEIRHGHWETRIPAWINYVVQTAGNPVYDGVFWQPEKPYEWKNKGYAKKPKSLRIYETHIGMSSEELRINSYQDFRQNVLPYIKSIGYNAIQVMAIMEHAYYASFGYQVTSFFAASSRFGNPEDLKQLVDDCHGLGIVVLLDIVHSHASNNVADGLNNFDGTPHHLFHAPPRGRHELWDSRLFNYGNWETLRFLLSNVAWWLEEYHFDGFRFDGVTSMLYVHHGLGAQNFDYEHYFGGAVDGDALAYLTLANDVIHAINPDAISVAEDVSGFPGLCRPTYEGGIGFDYRLQMACPDLWIKILKTQKDEEWNVSDIAYQLSNRRWMEPCIAYAESHDQALVGDKTIAFWLMDKDMYEYMTVLRSSLVVERGMALHKLIRLLTCMLGGEGWLCFMGNEFGHPEWIDFPRAGNGNSYHHCRRQWHLVKDHLLRYKFLGNWDKALMALEEKTGFLASAPAFISLKHQSDKVLVFERAGLVVAVNLHPSLSLPNYRIPVSRPGKYVPVLSSDSADFDGQKRVELDGEHFTEKYQAYGVFEHSMKVYLPSRCAVVFSLADSS